MILDKGDRGEQELREQKCNQLSVIIYLNCGFRQHNSCVYTGLLACDIAQKSKSHLRMVMLLSDLS